MTAQLKPYYAIVGALCIWITPTDVDKALGDEIPLDQVPNAVREAIEREASGGIITEIESESKDGRTIYEVEIEREGREIEIKIAEDGTLLGNDGSREEELPPDRVPESARAELVRLAGGTEFIKFSRKKAYGALAYQAEWSAGATTHEAVVAADGTLLETEEVISMEHSPAAVRAAAAKRFGANAAVVLARKTIIVYEAEARIKGKKKELVISPTGRVLEELDEDDNDDDDGHDDNEDDDDDDDDDD